MKNSTDLHIVLARKSTLYAQQYPGRFMPVILLVGLLLWVWTVVLVTADRVAVAGVVLAVFSLLCFAAALATLRMGAWLSIDCHRGWIHWQSRWLRKNIQESFSPQRIERLAIRRIGFQPPRPGLWVIQLELDHPRLRTINLARAVRLSTVHRIAQRLAVALAIDWADERGTVRPGKSPAATSAAKEKLHDSWHGVEWLRQMPPPPEIEVDQWEDRTRFVLPNAIGFQAGRGMFLVYALLWCLWAWTTLIIQLLTTPPFAKWDEGEKIVFGMIVICAALGALMLGLALYLFQRRQTLEQAGSGWLLTHRWLGRYWGGRMLIWNKKSGWVRQIDPPSEEAGIWIPAREGEMRLGAGLSAEGLLWLSQLLVR